MAQLAFPHNDILPPNRVQFGLFPQISVPITFEFRSPEIQFGFRHPSQFAGWIRVSMPKTSVDKNYFAAGLENEVRYARQPPIVKAISESHPMDHAANDHLRLGVTSTHTRHALTSLSFVESIRHGQSLNMRSSTKSAVLEAKNGLMVWNAEFSWSTEMALIKSFTQKNPERDSKHTEAKATWYVGGVGQTRFLQIDTYGSPDRLIAGKVSQSIRLDARAANELRALINRAFPA